MSTNALFWALRFRGLSSGAKFVLIALADVANNNGEAFPSIAHLSEVTEQNRKSVVRNLQRLIEHGIIEDTERRVGRTGQVIVYKLHMTPDLFDQELRRASEETQKETQKRNDSTFGTVEQVCGQITVSGGYPVDKWNWNSPNFSTKSPNLGAKETQIWDTDPLITSYNQKLGKGSKTPRGEKIATPPKADKKSVPKSVVALQGWSRAIEGMKS